MTKEKLSAEKSESSNEKAISGKRLKKALVEVSFFLLGGLLLSFALFGGTDFLRNHFSTLDFVSWSVFVKIALIATVLSVLGWIRIFWGFLAQSLDEYDEAVAARFMRMTSFLVVFLWVLAYIKSDAVWRSFVTAYLKFVKFGQINAGTLFCFVALLLLATATVYFIVRWVMLRFFEWW